MFVAVQAPPAATGAAANHALQSEYVYRFERDIQRVDNSGTICLSDTHMTRWEATRGSFAKRGAHVLVWYALGFDVACGPLHL